jgi:hypothetical protein
VQLGLCRSCYRGQEFCRPCAVVARRESCREYERTYRGSLAGKLGNARRQADYRQRKRAERLAAAVVTHQGSGSSAESGQERPPIAVEPTGGDLAAASSPPVADASGASPTAQPEVTHAIRFSQPEPVRLERCSFCGCVLPAFARRPGAGRRRWGARPRRGWRR